MILRRVALVDQKSGWAFRVRLGRELRPFRSRLKTFASAVSAMPEATEFYRMAGGVDYMLRVVVATWRHDVFSS